MYIQKQCLHHLYWHQSGIYFFTITTAIEYKTHKFTTCVHGQLLFSGYDSSLMSGTKTAIVAVAKHGLTESVFDLNRYPKR